MSINDLVKSRKQHPIRRAYIKRKLVDGTYESDWFRIDYLQGLDRVLDWGSFSLELDFQPGEIGNFEISGMTMVMDNQHALFNSEVDSRSIFYPEFTYSNRRYTKIKIECGYLDEDTNTEVGVETVFEGIIERVTLSEDQTASLELLPYTAILNSYLIVDLGLNGTATVSSVITSIMNQSKITEYIPYIEPTNTFDPQVIQLANLEGTYWDIIKQLAQQSDSVPLLNGSSFEFKDRSANSVTWNFLGLGNVTQDIHTVTSYDDEGADRVRLFWQAEGSTVTAISSDSALKIKYLNSPQIINLDNYNNSTKQSILNKLLATWETPRPSVSFTTNFMINIVSLLDKITLKISGPAYPINTTKWGGGHKWGDGIKWGEARGAVNISSGTYWMVTRIVKNINEWMFEIHSEKVV